MREAVKLYHENEHGIFLIQEERETGPTYWTLPGGKLDEGEGYEDALRRELREELHCEIRIGEVIDTVEYQHRTMPDWSEYQIITGDIQGEIHPDCSVIGYGWFTNPPERILAPFEALF